MYCTSSHWETDRVMTEVEHGSLRLGVLLYSHPSSSSAAAASKLPLHWPEMPSWGRNGNKLLLLVAASVVSSATVIRPDCYSRWLRPPVMQSLMMLWTSRGWRTVVLISSSSKPVTRLVRSLILVQTTLLSRTHSKQRLGSQATPVSYTHLTLPTILRV